MYNQSYQPSFGQPMQSQYRGYQKTFQPTGYVQSFYQGQQPSASAGNMQAQNYHTANYAGNIQGHDAYLRADSVNPTSYGGGHGQAQSQYQNNVPTQQSSNSWQASTPTSYHTQNYAGDRPDHDAYLRADSTRPSSYTAGRTQGIGSMNQMQSQFQTNMPTNQFQAGHMNQFGQFRNF